MSRALAGVKVVEWSMAVAGPEAGQLLGSLGAEVIKIEERERGDPFRGVKKVGGLVPVEGPGGRSLFFEGFNFNKRSLALDLKQERGREIVYRMVERADVFLTNFRREAGLRLGLDYETLRGYNPKLIYARVSGFGPEGADRDDPAYDLAALARSGAMMAMKPVEYVPYSPWGVADEMAAMCAAYGIVTALFHRERTGQGQEVNISLLGGMLHLLRIQLMVKLLAGEDFKPFDRRSAGNPLLNIYRAGDEGWFCLAMGSLADKYWAPLCRALGLEELEHDPRFQNLAAREEHREELIAILDQVFARRPRPEWLSEFKKWGIIGHPVNQLSEVIDDPQALANNYIADYPHPVLGEVKLVGSPVHFSTTPAVFSAPTPELGQHTEEVLLETGYSWEDIAELREAGVI